MNTMMEEEEEERKVILSITVEVEDGRLEFIEIRNGDSAEAAAIKFCETHSLSRKFIAPLTEHIVQEVRRISKVDNSIKFASEDGVAYMQHETQIHNSGSSQVDDGTQLLVPDQDRDSDYKSDKELTSRDNQDRQSLKAHMLSHSLLSPTFTSLAKTQLSSKEEEGKDNRRSGRLSERAKSVYMRLYGEFLRQKQRIEEEKRWYQEEFQERIEREKPSISKQTGKANPTPGWTCLEKAYE